MERRTFVTAIPVAAIALPTISGETLDAVSIDPHPEWLKQWKAVENLWLVFEEKSPESDAAWDERTRLALLLCQTPTTTAHGLTAQIQWFIADLGYLTVEGLGDDYAGVLDTMLVGASNLAEVV
jgi:hypothetical protein